MGSRPHDIEAPLSSRVQQLLSRCGAVGFKMLFSIAAVLVGLWLLGLFFRIAGAFIHLFLIIAVVMVILSLISGHLGHP